VIRFAKDENVVGVENNWHSDVSWREATRGFPRTSRPRFGSSAPYTTSSIPSGWHSPSRSVRRSAWSFRRRLTRS
jgi:hypothetical protein